MTARLAVSHRRRWHSLVFVLATLACAARPVGAQNVERTIGEYDRELGVKYVLLYEEGGYIGTPGVLIEGGFRIRTLGDWRLQAVGEVMFVRVSDFDATYKHGAAGIRFGRMLSPKTRAFAQFQVGIQNDGFEDSSTGLALVPGGGVNYALTEGFDLQVMVDLPVIRYSGHMFNQVRLAVGIGLPLGN